MKRIVRTLPVMYVGENKVIPFRIGVAMEPGEAIVGQPVTTCVAYSGVDGSPAGRLVGPPVVDGTSVLQRFVPTLPKVTYLIKCEVTISPSGEKIVAAAYLPVRNAGQE